MSEIIEYSKTEAALTELRKYKKEYDVKTSLGMDEARKARAEVKKYRVSLEAMRVELKAPALERCRLIDAEAKRITAELAAIEDPIDSAIKNEEWRRAEEKAAAEAAKAAEQADAAAMCDRLRSGPLTYIGKTSESIAAGIAKLEALGPYHSEKYAEDVEKARQESVAKMRELLAATQEREADAAEAAKARAELDRLRMKAESDARAAAEKIAADEAAAKAKREADDREAARARAAADAEAATARAKEDARIAGERAKLDAERRADEKRKAEAQAAEEAKAQAKRDADEKKKAHAAEELHKSELRKAATLDARALLSQFVARFGNLEEFAEVVKAINALTWPKAATKKAASAK